MECARHLGPRADASYKQALNFSDISENPMLPSNTNSAVASDTLLPDRRVAGPIAIVALQAVAAIYFIVDGIDDLITQASRGFSLEIAMECIVAFALLGGVVMGSRYIGCLTDELRRKDRSLANVRGTFAEHIALRFDEWGLTPGEGEVALFALKGCDVTEIARLRNAAAGTVRSQLSQIYAKAEVSSQAMLVSLFIEDLLEPAAR